MLDLTSVDELSGKSDYLHAKVRSVEMPWLVFWRRKRKYALPRDLTNLIEPVFSKNGRLYCQ